MDPVRRNELLCRQLNPGAREFFHDLGEKGVQFGAPNHIALGHHESYGLTVIQRKGLDEIWESIYARERASRPGRLECLARRLFGRYDVAGTVPRPQAELLCLEDLVDAGGKLLGPLSSLIIDESGRLACPRHPVRRVTSEVHWNGVPTGTPRTLELLNGPAPFFLKLSVDRAAKNSHRTDKGAKTDSSGGLVSRRQLNRLKVDLKKRIMKIVWNCDNVDAGAITMRDALLCLAISLELIDVIDHAPPRIGMLREVAAIFETDGRGCVVREGVAYPRSPEPEVLVPFYSLGFGEKKSGVELHLLQDLAVELDMAVADVVSQACSLYALLWYHLSFVAGYYLSCPHGQNAMLSIGEDGSFRRIVLKDMRDIERLDRYYAITADLQNVALISRCYLSYEQTVHPLYFQYRPYLDRRRQLASNALAYSWWMLQNRGFAPLFRGVESLVGKEEAMRARWSVLLRETGLLVTAAPESGLRVRAEVLAARFQRAFSNGTGSLRAYKRARREFYSCLRSNWIRKAELV